MHPNIFKKRGYIDHLQMEFYHTLSQKVFQKSKKKHLKSLESRKK